MRTTVHPEALDNEERTKPAGARLAGDEKRSVASTRERRVADRELLPR